MPLFLSELKPTCPAGRLRPPDTRKHLAFWGRGGIEMKELQAMVLHQNKHSGLYIR